MFCPNSENNKNKAEKALTASSYYHVHHCKQRQLETGSEHSENEQSFLRIWGYMATLVLALWRQKNEFLLLNQTLRSSCCSQLFGHGSNLNQVYASVSWFIFRLWLKGEFCTQHCSIVEADEQVMAIVSDMSQNESYERLDCVTPHSGARFQHLTENVVWVMDQMAKARMFVSWLSWGSTLLLVFYFGFACRAYAASQRCLYSATLQLGNR